MAIDITIGSTVISFPETGDAPTWSEALVEFAQAVESAILTSGGPYDVSPQIYDITAFNNDATYRDVPNLSFPVSNVRAATIEYSIYRITDTAANRKYEKGKMEVLYDTSAGSWILTRDFEGNGTGASSVIDFQITNGGQVQFRTATNVVGTNYAAILSYFGKALQYT